MIRRLLFLLLMLVAAACEPTASSIPTPATIESTDVLGGVLTVTYPQTWSASQTEGNVILGSQPGISPESNVPPGAVAVNVSGIASALAATLVTDGSITPTTLLNAYSNTLSDDIQTGTITETTLNGKAAARLAISANEGDSLIIAVEHDGAFIVVIGVTAKGELAQQEAAIVAIAEQATYDIAAE